MQGVCVCVCVYVLCGSCLALAKIVQQLELRVYVHVSGFVSVWPMCGSDNKRAIAHVLKL